MVNGDGGPRQVGSSAWFGLCRIPHSIGPVTNSTACVVFNLSREGSI